jgi:hypothetical protein
MQVRTYLNALGYLSLPDLTLHRYAAVIRGIKLSHYVNTTCFGLTGQLWACKLVFHCRFLQGFHSAATNVFGFYGFLRSNSHSLLCDAVMAIGPMIEITSSSEDGNRSSFRNVVISRYLEFRTIDKVQKNQ